MSSLQPYYSKSLDNYWISFSSADLTGGRVHMRIINSNYRFFSPFYGIRGIISSAVGRCYDASPHNTSITVGYCNPIGADLKNETLNSILKFNSPEYSPNGFKTNSSTDWNVSDIYQNLGTKRGDKEYTVFRKNYGSNNAETDCIVDGFLGYNNPNDFYGISTGKIALYGERYDDDKSGITTGTDNIISTLNGNVNVNREDIEVDYGEGGKTVNVSIYALRSPTFWTQSRKEDTEEDIKNEQHRPVDLNAGTFHKIREAHAYGVYGMINGKNSKKQFNSAKPEEWDRPYDYSEMLMFDLLSTQFFNRKAINQIYTI